MVPEVSETDKQRHHRCRKGTGEKHPQRGFAAVNALAKNAGLLQHLHPWQRSDDRQTAKHFPGHRLSGRGVGGRRYHRVETGTQHGEHLQRHPDGHDGCFCLHYIEQREHHHETYDEPFHHPDGADPYSQFLRHERRYPSGTTAPCLRADCHFFYLPFSPRFRGVQEDKVVLNKSNDKSANSKFVT